LGAFYLLLITQPDGLCLVISSRKIAAQGPTGPFWHLSPKPPLEHDASSRQGKAKPFGRRFAIRLCPDNLACVVNTAGDGERDGGFDSGSMDDE